MPSTTNDCNLQANKLLSLTDDFFLQQLISEPTRNQNVLDLVFTNIADEPFDCKITSHKTISDHNLIELKLYCDNIIDDSKLYNKPKAQTHQSGYRQYNFYKADYTSINEDLSDINWHKEMGDESVSDQLPRFNEILLDIVSKHTSKIQSRKNYKSKFYKERRALWRRRNRLHQKSVAGDKRDKLLEEIEISIKKSHKAERLHDEHKAIDKISTNAKYFYSYANKTRKPRDKVGPLTNKETKEIISDPSDMAEALQSQYCSVFSKPDPNKCIDNIKTFFNEENNNDAQKLLDIDFSEADIVTAIKQIKAHSAAGPDGIPSILLRNCCEELSKPLYLIYRKSLDTGEVPNLLKDAIVTPIHKGGLKCDPKNYRPVSLLSQLLKILEKVLCLKIVKHLEENNKMNKNQHGFRKFRSCLSQLIEHYDNVLEAVSSGNNIDVIYLDYSKAFDVVDHDILLRKLRDSGISGKMGIWISNFLKNRKQTVTVNQKLSRSEPVPSGVPQGSVLGPILFLIMIADIDVDILKKSTVSSFADDTKVSHVIKLRQDCDDLQASLQTIYEWSENNNLNFNELKFQALRYGVNKETEGHNYITPTGKNIPNEDTIRDLGLRMSRNLKFHHQTETISSKCRSLSGWILRTFTTRETKPMLKLFNSLLLPRVDYCSQIWSPHQSKDWNRLESIQRRFTSKISEVSHLDYWSRLRRLKQYSLERRAERYKIIYTWKILESLAPNPSTNKLVTKYSERRGRSCVLPRLARQQTCSAKINTIRENSFCFQGPKLFNCLPKSIRNITNVTVDTFKHHLDKLLSTVPDQPGVPGYVGSRAAASNSILDQMSNGGGICDADL